MMIPRTAGRGKTPAKGSGKGKGQPKPAPPRREKRNMGIHRRLPKQIIDNPYEMSLAFWNPRGKVRPPPLRTTFGHMTTIALEKTLQITTDTVNDVYLLVLWTPSPLACVTMNNGAFGMATYKYPVSTNNPPVSARPLRMAVEIGCTTQTINEAGFVRCMPVEQSIDLPLQLGSAAATPALLLSTPDMAFGTLVTGASTAFNIMSRDLDKSRTFVCTPNSYPYYNAYYDFNGIATADTTPSSTAFLRSDDMLTLINGSVGLSGTYPYTTSTVVYSRASVISSGTLFGVPPITGWLFQFAPTTTAQTFQVTVRRQDGCRYPMNTLGAQVAAPVAHVPAHVEDNVNTALSHAVSVGRHALTQVVDRVSEAAVDTMVRRAVSSLAIEG